MVAWVLLWVGLGLFLLALAINRYTWRLSLAEARQTTREIVGSERSSRFYDPFGAAILAGLMLIPHAVYASIWQLLTLATMALSVVLAAPAVIYILYTEKGWPSLLAAVVGVGICLSVALIAGSYYNRR